MKAKIFALLIALGWTAAAFAQSEPNSGPKSNHGPETEATTLAETITVPRFRWEVRFDTKFDNREFASLTRVPTIRSRTLFSGRLVPVVGIGWGEHHSVMAGGSFTLDMGAPLASRPIEPLIYYNYSSARYALWAGKFERRRLIGIYSRAIIGGLASFYDNVIDGLAMQFTPRGGKLELALDWDGVASKTTRESFRILSAGEVGIPIAARWLSIGYSAEMYHLASREGGGDGVVDHITAAPVVGLHLERFAPWFERLYLGGGWLQMLGRDRGGENKWIRRGGATVDFVVQKWRVGIRNSFYVGDVQMPMWELAGNRIYRGDPFFASAPLYNYTQIYWRPRIGRGVELDLELGIHTDGHNVGWQQVAWVGVSIDEGLFRRRRR